MMHRRLVPLLAAALVTTAPVAVSAAPASAATCTPPTFVGAEVRPGTVVLGTTRVKALDVLADVTNGCTLTSVKLVYTTPTSTSPSFTMPAVAGDQDLTTYASGLDLYPAQAPNSEAGTWKATITARWSSGKITTSATVKVVRESRLTTNASPEPVVKGKAITVKGTLTRANWQTGKYVGYPKQQVQLQFRPTNGSYAAVKTVPSGTAGALTTSVPANKDGCFRFVFAGSSTTGKVTGAQDCIDVR
jgi:hypothetical protein